jgi:hypothetical protein
LGLSGPVGGAPPGCAGRLVVAVRVKDELAEERTGGNADDSDVQVLDEQHDAGPSMGVADANVVEPATVTQGDRAVGVDTVLADAHLGVALSVAGGSVVIRRAFDVHGP